MSIFTLAISCLTTSSLPWFMNLIFQVPMQYCSSQPQTLLSSPDASIMECHFHFSPDASLFLELLAIAFHSSPVDYLDTSWPVVGGGLIFVSYLFAFPYCPWGSLGKDTGVDCHFLFQWATFCQNSSLWPVYLGWNLHGMAHSFIELCKPLTITRLWYMKETIPVSLYLLLYYQCQYFFASLTRGLNAEMCKPIPRH